jgi:aspartyl-tRNA synthetase
MKYRYLDIREPVKKQFTISSQRRSASTSDLDFEVETPYLIKSTPEGARDFVVPSRMNEGNLCYNLHKPSNNY